MNPRDIVISGVGVVSPLGCDANVFWRKLQAEERGHQREIHFDGRPSTRCFSPPAFDVDEIISASRLRRVSPITQFACAAAALAIRDANLALDNKTAMRRVGVVTAVSHGGISFTLQFHSELVQQGARAASPMLFPETVYNAPSSHLAAVLGCDHVNYTVVGDAAAAYNAVAMARDLLTLDIVEHCLVVGAEEADWVVTNAYHRNGHRCITGEGAGAILLSKNRKGYACIVEVDRGSPIHSHAERKAKKSEANGSFTAQLGEAFTAGAVWQLIAHAFRTRDLQTQVRSHCTGLNTQASTIILAPV